MSYNSSKPQSVSDADHAAQGTVELEAVAAALRDVVARLNGLPAAVEASATASDFVTDAAGHLGAALNFVTRAAHELRRAGSLG